VLDKVSEADIAGCVTDVDERAIRAYTATARRLVHGNACGLGELIELSLSNRALQVHAALGAVLWTPTGQDFRARLLRHSDAFLQKGDLPQRFDPGKGNQCSL
jgi:hypothetical protein